MENLKNTDEMGSYGFADFPEDVQLCILSFLTPSEIANFACTSKRSVLLCRNDGKLWYNMCDRRWGSKTEIKKWGNGQISYKLLYRTLSEWDNLIGFWRRCGQPIPTAGTQSPPKPMLIYFEWGASFLAGSRVSPLQNGTYHVTKSPFLSLGISPKGQVLNFLDPDGNADLSDNLEVLENNLIPVNVNFMGNTHFVVEENLGFVSYCQKSGGFRRSSSSANLKGDDNEEVVIGAESGSPGSLPEMSEMYQYFANRTSPGSADRALRRQRRREKERQGRRRWETEHFVKVVECSPTKSRPLQGLWKGLCDGMNLEFYHLAYSDTGGIACRRVWDASESLSRCAPMFWTSNPTFNEPPFSPEEELIYKNRLHLQPLVASDNTLGQYPSMDSEEVSRMMYINSSYDIVVQDMAGTSANSWLVEGRIWQYKDGTFGFGFLRDNFIINLKHIIQDDCLLDTVEHPNDRYPCLESSLYM